MVEKFELAMKNKDTLNNASMLVVKLIDEGREQEALAIHEAVHNAITSGEYYGINALTEKYAEEIQNEENTKEYSLRDKIPDNNTFYSKEETEKDIAI